MKNYFLAYVYQFTSHACRLYTLRDSTKDTFSITIMFIGNLINDNKD